MNDPSPAAEPVSEPAPAPAAEPPAEPAAVRLSVPAVLLATVASAGTLLRLAAAFLAWFLRLDYDIAGIVMIAAMYMASFASIPMTVWNSVPQALTLDAA